MKKEIVYKGKIMTVLRRPVIQNGHIISFEQVRLRDSVHVIPITSKGKFLFIQEKKPGEKKISLKVLSGIVENKEKPIEAACRELKEEIGVKAKNITKLMSLSENGTIKDKRHYFIAKGLSFQKTNKEKTEDIKGIVSLTKEEMFQYLLEGKFGTSRSVIVLLKLNAKLSKEKEK